MSLLDCDRTVPTECAAYWNSVPWRLPMALAVYLARLGRGLIMLDPEACGSQSESGEEVSCEFVVARGDAPEVLELVEEAFDEVALAVDFEVDRAAEPDIALAWDVGGAACGLDEFDDAAREVSSIGEDIAAQAEPLEQGRRGRLVGGLARRQHQAHRQAVAIDDGMDLGAQSAARSSDGVIRTPFFPPAAC